MIEAFYRTHQHLVDNLGSPVRRSLMDEINWNDRLIGIKGSRGVGKTTFLLDFASKYHKEDRSCLYINLNNFYFTERTLLEFADEFCKKGGKILLIDQVFKYPNWSSELKQIYELLPDLKVVFTGSSVMRLRDENHEIGGIVTSYNLRGFSFREFINYETGLNFGSYSLEEILKNHLEIAKIITEKIRPLAFFQDYLHHGYYPLFLEQANYSENLLKTINLMLEIDITYIKQVELKYLTKLRALFNIISKNAPANVNVSKLSKQIQTSRATVMNYIKYLKDARLINLLYPVTEDFPKKPEKIFLHNTNLYFAINRDYSDQMALNETFFYNMVHKDHKINSGLLQNTFLINKKLNFNVVKGEVSEKNNNVFYASEMAETGSGNVIPL